MHDTEINVGVVLALSPAGEAEPVRAFAKRLVGDCTAELNEATRLLWRFHHEDNARLSGDDPRRPSDFLDEASLRMAEGPYDMVLVITDVALVSRRQRVVAGLASRVGRVAVISTRKLLISPRGRATRRLDDAEVRRNAATLLLHLVGHMLGLDHAHAPGSVMAPFRFVDDLDAPRRFSEAERRELTRRSAGFPEREHRGQGALGTLSFHLTSAARHPLQVLKPLWRNRAPLLPLSLPTLATAAVAPTLILVFTAEIWDAGLNMPERVVWTFAGASILTATAYLVGVHSLFFPREEKRVTTEHMAVVNVTILLTMLLAMLGLFGMVALLMLFIETYVFPPGLISEWPTLEDPVVTLRDKLLLASFISTLSVLTGALAGGVESRAVIRHLALFEDEP